MSFLNLNKFKDITYEIPKIYSDYLYFRLFKRDYIVLKCFKKLFNEFEKTFNIKFDSQNDNLINAYNHNIRELIINFYNIIVQTDKKDFNNSLLFCLFSIKYPNSFLKKYELLCKDYKNFKNQNSTLLPLDEYKCLDTSKIKKSYFIHEPFYKKFRKYECDFYIQITKINEETLKEIQQLDLVNKIHENIEMITKLFYCLRYFKELHNIHLLYKTVCYDGKKMKKWRKEDLRTSTYYNYTFYKIICHKPNTKYFKKIANSDCHNLITFYLN